MALSTDDVQAIEAEWEKWIAGAGFRLSIEVKRDIHSELVQNDPPGSIGARLMYRFYCQVQVWRGDDLVFSERVPDDAALLRASVAVLAAAIRGPRG